MHQSENVFQDKLSCMVLSSCLTYGPKLFRYFCFLVEKLYLIISVMCHLKRRCVILIWCQTEEIALTQFSHQFHNFFLVILQLTFLLTGDQIFPCVITFLNDLQCIRFILEFFLQPKHIRWLPIWNLVCAEPLTNGVKLSWEMLINVSNVVKKWCPFVFRIDDYELPVSLAFVYHAKNTQNFHWTNLSGIDNPHSNVTNI
mmetsp:Transcript_6175/g.8941  ORF Transcript_6175/g.8941 Transcript_6175/m.8941 type:complete len:200 (+) Transcript_6175:213-812(+)